MAAPPGKNQQGNAMMTKVGKYRFTLAQPNSRITREANYRKSNLPSHQANPRSALQPPVGSLLAIPWVAGRGMIEETPKWNSS
jgi:hypothetical protein